MTNPTGAPVTTLSHGAWGDTIDSTTRAELTEIQSVMDELGSDGVWLGKTAALFTVADQPDRTGEPGHIRYSVRSCYPYFTSDDPHRLGPDGLPLAWSCWDIAQALVTRIRDRGQFKAWLLDANGAEQGAYSEPHAVVGIQSRATRTLYIADPYFNVGPMVHADVMTSSHTSALVAGQITGWNYLNRECPQTRLGVRHIAYRCD